MKNKHHRLLRLCILIGIILHSSFGILRSQVPNLISYQGRVAVGTTNFNGTGQFKFVLYNPGGIISVWSNDSTSIAGQEPTSAVSLTVTKGLYSVLLGDSTIPNMHPIPASVWANGNLYLRVWFSDGTNGFQLLTPDQRLAPNGYLPDGSVSSAAISAGAVTSGKIGAGAVDTASLANGSVGAAQLAADAVTTGKIATSAVTSLRIADLAVTGPKIADSAIITTKINDGAVATAKIANNAVTTAQIANGAVTTPQIANLAVTNSKIADGAVNTAQLADTAVTSAKINNGAVGTLKIADGAVTAAKLGADVGLWSVNGSDVHRASGKVGIGTATPSTELDVTGTVTAGTLNTGLLQAGSGVISGMLYVGPGATRIHTTNSGFDIAIGAPSNPTSTTGGGNVNIGYESLFNLWSLASGNYRNTAVGYLALRNSTGNSNIALGATAGLALNAGSDNIYIGNDGNNGLNTGLINESGAIRLGTPGTHNKTLLAGKVGIGTTSPGVPLDVVGFVGSSQVATYFSASSTGLTTAPTVVNASIRASNEIQAAYFSAVSDARIKNVQGQSDSAADLQTLLGIEITDYRYKDVAEKGDRPTKKVVAQQVEKVYPQAVSRSTNVIPDIFKKAPIKNGWVALATDLKAGDRVRLITEKGHLAVHEVKETGKDKFRTDFTEEVGQVFVYGREVDDFRAVDYEAIAMLNVSATQELARRLEAKDAEIAALKKQLAEQAVTMKTLAARQAEHDEALEARLAQLEHSAESNAVKVALKK